MVKKLLADKILVKFVRANMLLPYISYNYELRGTYFIIRHPCATIYSQLKTNYTGYFNLGIVTIKKIVRNQINNIVELQDKQQSLLPKIDGLGKPIEILSLTWALDHYIPLCYQKQRWWYTIVYEKLVLENIV